MDIDSIKADLAELTQLRADLARVTGERDRCLPVVLAAIDIPRTLATELAARGMAYSSRRIANLIEQVVEYESTPPTGG